MRIGSTEESFKSTGSKEKRVTHKKDQGQEKALCGPKNQVFSLRTKLPENILNFLTFCLCLNINSAISAYFAAPASHQDLGHHGNPFAYLAKPV
jgi:p-aminobenzoyl-glutamate transporter AbgT